MALHYSQAIVAFQQRDDPLVIQIETASSDRQRPERAASTTENPISYFVELPDSPTPSQTRSLANDSRESSPTTGNNVNAPLLSPEHPNQVKILNIKQNALTMATIYWAYQAMLVVGILTTTDLNCKKYWMGASLAGIITQTYTFFSYKMAGKYIKLKGGNPKIHWIKFSGYIIGVVGISCAIIMGAALMKPCG